MGLDSLDYYVIQLKSLQDENAYFFAGVNYEEHGGWTGGNGMVLQLTCRFREERWKYDMLQRKHTSKIKQYIK